MGNTKLRRIFKSECKWKDKNAKRHKHIYNTHAVMQLRNMLNLKIFVKKKVLFYLL